MLVVDNNDKNVLFSRNNLSQTCKYVLIINELWAILRMDNTTNER